MVIFSKNLVREDYIANPLKASYTRKAGHTKAFRNPTTPIQKPVDCEINQTAAPINPSPYTALDPPPCARHFAFSFMGVVINVILICPALPHQITLPFKFVVPTRSALFQWLSLFTGLFRHFTV